MKYDNIDGDEGESDNADLFERKEIRGFRHTNMKDLRDRQIAGATAWANNEDLRAERAYTDWQNQLNSTVSLYQAGNQTYTRPDAYAFHSPGGAASYNSYVMRDEDTPRPEHHRYMPDGDAPPWIANRGLAVRHHQHQPDYPASARMDYNNGMLLYTQEILDRGAAWNTPRNHNNFGGRYW